LINSDLHEQQILLPCWCSRPFKNRSVPVSFLLVSFPEARAGHWHLLSMGCVPLPAFPWAAALRGHGISCSFSEETEIGT